MTGMKISFKLLHCVTYIKREKNELLIVFASWLQQWLTLVALKVLPNRDIPGIFGGWALGPSSKNSRGP